MSFAVASAAPEYPGEASGMLKYVTRWRVVLATQLTDVFVIIAVALLLYPVSGNALASMPSRYFYSSFFAAFICHFSFSQGRAYEIDVLLNETRGIRAIFARWSLLFLGGAALVALTRQPGLYSRMRFASYPQLTTHGLLAKILYWIAGYGHAGVVIFFVLSGFLVGGKAIDLSNTENIHVAWKYFLVDRFVRIFIVLWPALLLDFVVVVCLGIFVPAAPFYHQYQWGWDLQTPIRNDLQITRWLGAAALFNGLAVPTLTSDSPLWSLSYEWFYYMASLSVVLIYRKICSWSALILILYVMVLLVLIAINNLNILYLGIVWLLGAGSYIAFKRKLLQGPWVRYISITVFFIILIMDRIYSIADIVLGASLAIVIAHSDWSSWKFCARLGDELASFSYSLYVTHYPIMLAIMATLFYFGQLDSRLQFEGGGISIALMCLVFAICFSRLFAFTTEYRTKYAKKLLRDRRIPR